MTASRIIGIRAIIKNGRQLVALKAQNQPQTIFLSGTHIKSALGIEINQIELLIGSFIVLNSIRKVRRLLTEKFVLKIIPGLTILILFWKKIKLPPLLDS